MDYKSILNLMKEMNHTDLTKLEIEEEGIRICIEKAAPVMNVMQPALSQAAFVADLTAATPGLTQAQLQSPAGDTQLQIAAQTAAPADNSLTVKEASDKLAEEGTKKLVSPMVGTFYTAAGPDKPPFVKVGDKVKKGQTVCIIEAMKLMNEIESEFDGEIVKILINNEEMVEYGQPLFLMK